MANTTAKTAFALLIATAFLALAAGSVAAQSSGFERETQSDSFSQRVDLPRENVFAALALREDADIEDIGNIDLTRSRTGSLTRDVDLNDDDVFLALALDLDGDDFFDDALGLDDFSRGSRGGIGLFDLDTDDLDDDLRAADIDRNVGLTRSLSQRVNVDRDDVLFSLALDNGGRSGGLFDSDFDDAEFDSGFFSSGSRDFLDIADVDRTVSETRLRDTDIDLDEDDTFLTLALD